MFIDFFKTLLGFPNFCRLYFTFTDIYGGRRNVTESFYPAPEYRRQFDKNEYILDYETKQSQFRYRLIISGVHYSQLIMSRDARKPVFGGSDQV